MALGLTERKRRAVVERRRVQGVDVSGRSDGFGEDGGASSLAAAYLQDAVAGGNASPGMCQADAVACLAEFDG
jgi:hypothetical protein